MLKMLTLSSLFLIAVAPLPVSAQEELTCTVESMSELCPEQEQEQEQPTDEEVVEVQEELIEEEPVEQNNADKKGELNLETVAGHEPTVTEGAVLGASTENQQVLAATTPRLAETGTNLSPAFVGVLLVATALALHYKGAEA